MILFVLFLTSLYILYSSLVLLFLYFMYAFLFSSADIFTSSVNHGLLFPVALTLVLLVPKASAALFFILELIFSQTMSVVSFSVIQLVLIFFF